MKYPKLILNHNLCLEQYLKQQIATATLIATILQLFQDQNLSMLTLTGTTELEQDQFLTNWSKPRSQIIWPLITVLLWHHMLALHIPARRVSASIHSLCISYSTSVKC